MMSSEGQKPSKKKKTDFSFAPKNRIDRYLKSELKISHGMFPNLTSKQANFVINYVSGMSQIQAALKAGYGAEYARIDLTRKPAIRAAIQKYAEQAITKSVATRTEVLEKLTGFIRDEKLSTKERVNAMRLMSQMQGWLTMKISGPDGGPIQIQDVSNMETSKLLEIIEVTSSTTAETKQVDSEEIIEVDSGSE